MPPSLSLISSVPFSLVHSLPLPLSLNCHKELFCLKSPWNHRLGVLWGSEAAVGIIWCQSLAQTFQRIPRIVIWRKSSGLWFRLPWTSGNTFRVYPFSAVIFVISLVTMEITGGNASLRVYGWSRAATNRRVVDQDGQQRVDNMSPSIYPVRQPSRGCK